MKQKLPSYLVFPAEARAKRSRAISTFMLKVERSLATTVSAVTRTVSKLAYDLVTAAYHRSLRALEYLDAPASAYDDSGWEREAGLRSGRSVRAGRALGPRRPALHPFSPLPHRQNLPRPGSPKYRPVC